MATYDALVPWPLDQLLQDRGDSAALVTAEGNASLANARGGWAREVEAFIDVPLGSISELYALENLRGSLINREISDDKRASRVGDSPPVARTWLSVTVELLGGRGAVALAWTRLCRRAPAAGR